MLLHQVGGTTHGPEDTTQPPIKRAGHRKAPHHVSLGAAMHYGALLFGKVQDEHVAVTAEEPQRDKALECSVRSDGLASTCKNDLDGHPSSGVVRHKVFDINLSHLAATVNARYALRCRWDGTF